jgi:hypothetical protein
VEKVERKLWGYVITISEAKLAKYLLAGWEELDEARKGLDYQSHTVTWHHERPPEYPE